MVCPSVMQFSAEFKVHTKLIRSTTCSACLARIGNTSFFSVQLTAKMSHRDEIEDTAKGLPTKYRPGNGFLNGYSPPRDRAPGESSGGDGPPHQRRSITLFPEVRSQRLRLTVPQRRPANSPKGLTPSQGEPDTQRQDPDLPDVSGTAHSASKRVPIGTNSLPPHSDVTDEARYIYDK